MKVYSVLAKVAASSYFVSKLGRALEGNGSIRRERSSRRVTGTFVFVAQSGISRMRPKHRLSVFSTYPRAFSA
jgi:hypothetical protein